MAHGHFGLAGLVDVAMRAHVAVTVRGAVAVARLGGGVPCDKVLPIMIGAVPRDGRALTEAAWHQLGQESGVDGNVRRRHSGGQWRR
jgi:hypothetical protein